MSGETSARGMMTSSPFPRKRQRGAAKHVLLGKAPTSLLVAPSSVCPSFSGCCWSTPASLVSVPSGTQSRVRPPDPELQDRTPRPSSGPGHAWGWRGEGRPSQGRGDPHSVNKIACISDSLPPPWVSRRPVVSRSLDC